MRKRTGAGEIVRLGSFPTALGTMWLAASRHGVVACSLPGGSRGHVAATVRRRLPRARLLEGGGRDAPGAHLRGAARAAQEFLAGKRRSLDVPLDLQGTPFQMDVWSALRRVPYGSTVSYAEIARRAGRPRAVRACGTAHGANPVPLFVPCHRTIASDGSPGGFGGRLPLKLELIALESSARSLM